MGEFQYIALFKKVSDTGTFEDFEDTIFNIAADNDTQALIRAMNRKTALNLIENSKTKFRDLQQEKIVLFSIRRQHDKKCVYMIGYTIDE